MTEFFGEETGGWGDGEAPGDPEDGPGGEALGEEIDLGGGIKLKIHPEAFRLIMHTPEITARVAQRCEAICDEANNMAVIDGAEYVFVVSNRPQNIRARGRVKTANVKAQEDDERNSTLLKALASVGSDPYPTGEESADLALIDQPADLDEYQSIAQATGEGTSTWKAGSGPGEAEEEQR